MSTDLQLAFQLADVADAIAVDAWSPSGVTSTTKSDGSPVTEADIAAEHAMRISWRHVLLNGLVGEELRTSRSRVFLRLTWTESNPIPVYMPSACLYLTVLLKAYFQRPIEPS